MEALGCTSLDLYCLARARVKIDQATRAPHAAVRIEMPDLTRVNELECGLVLCMPEIPAARRATPTKAVMWNAISRMTSVFLFAAGKQYVFLYSNT